MEENVEKAGMNSVGTDCTLYLSPDRDIDGAMWHVSRIEYSIVVRLPRRGIEGFGPGPRSIVEGQNSVRFDILQKSSLDNTFTQICCNKFM